MSVVVEIPPPHKAHYRHAVELLLRWALPIPFTIVEGAGADYRLTVPGHDGAVNVPDVFLRAALDAWLKPSTLPGLPTERWDPRALYPGADRGEDERLATPWPRLFAEAPTSQAVPRSPSSLPERLPIDVFGAAFFWATRYEEAVRPERDVHDRLPCAAGLASRLGLLERPIVHEYAEVLFRAVRRIAPGLPRPARSFRLRLSHDIDEAFRWAGVGLAGLARSVAGEVVRRRAPRRAAEHVARWIKVKRGDLSADPYVTYDRLMDESERRGVRSTFFFVADGSTGYRIDAPRVLAILRSIHARGRGIGLHSAYLTYRDEARAAREFASLREACERAGVEQPSWSNRQHVLRWDPLETPVHLSKLGFEYDATLGFAEHVGFRSGLCVDHAAFDLRGGVTLPMLHRPLVVMDATLTEPRYMSVAKNEGAIRAAIQDCKRAARTHGGDFGVLWHNSRLVDELDWKLYRAVLDA